MTDSTFKQGHYDVCVVGGGLSGLCAAIASARQGAKTVLVHERPVLGGNASSEVRMWVCGAEGKNLKETGILEEIQLENAYRNPTLNYTIWDRILYEKASFQPNLTLLLNTSCTNCFATGSRESRRISHIHCWQMATQTWHAIEASIFIDCSGDSILAPGSGADFRMGREARSEYDEPIAPSRADKKTMGNSLLIQTRRTDKPHPFIAPEWAYKFDDPEEIPFRMKGVSGANFWWIELGGLNNTIYEADKIQHELMKTAWGVWDYIKNRSAHKDEAECWDLEWLGALPGKRESRRYLGDKVLTQHDIEGRGQFADTIAYGGWPMDDHHPAGLLYPGMATIFHDAPSPYGIPYRCLYSRNVTNLMFAGRNISATHTALSSTRVMGTCSLLGQAAGTAAAMACTKGVSPSTIGTDFIAQLQQQLMSNDCYLPSFAREVDGLTQEATRDATSTLNNGHDRPIGEASNCYEGELGKSITFKWPTRRKIGGLRLTLDSNLNNSKRMPCSYPQNCVSRVPKTLLRAFRVECLDEGGQWKTTYREGHNYQRQLSIPLHVETNALRLVPEETWGSESVRLFSCEPQSLHHPGIPVPPVGITWSEYQKSIPDDDLQAPDSGLESEHRKMTLGSA